MNLRTLLNISLVFGSLSLLSIGGGNSVLPQMHKDAVNDFRWLTDRQFGDVFAIAQAAPGPSILIVTLIGYQAAGVVGAIVATVAMILPAGILVYLVCTFWSRAKESQWRHAVEKGFAPLSVGLILASGYVVLCTADISSRMVGLTLLSTVIFSTTKIHPLILVALGGVMGWAGYYTLRP